MRAPFFYPNYGLDCALLWPSSLPKFPFFCFFLIQSLGFQWLKTPLKNGLRLFVPQFCVFPLSPLNSSSRLDGHLKTSYFLTFQQVDELLPPPPPPPQLPSPSRNCQLSEPPSSPAATPRAVGANSSFFAPFLPPHSGQMYPPLCSCFRLF